MLHLVFIAYFERCTIGCEGFKIYFSRSLKPQNSSTLKLFMYAVFCMMNV